eukprot:scaffold7037_cov311-Pinguiococcus_pyrenoidosus.AAC.3
MPRSQADLSNVKRPSLPLHLFRSSTHWQRPPLSFLFGGLCAVHVPPPDVDLLLLEIPPVLFVHEHEVDVVLDAKLVVHASEGGREVQGRQVKTQRDRLALHWHPIHDLELFDAASERENITHRNEASCAQRGQEGAALTFVTVSLSLTTLEPAPADSRRMMASSMNLILMRTRRKSTLPSRQSFSRRLRRRLHQLDRKFLRAPPRKKEIQKKFCVGLGLFRVGLPHLLLLQVAGGVAAQDADADEVAQAHVEAVVALVGLVHVAEVEVEAGGVREKARGRQISRQRHEGIHAVAVVRDLDLPQQLHADALVLQRAAHGQTHHCSAGDVLVAGEHEQLLLQRAAPASGHHAAAALHVPQLHRASGAAAEAEERHAEASGGAKLRRDPVAPPAVTDGKGKSLLLGRWAPGEKGSWGVCGGGGGCRRSCDGKHVR